MAHTGGGELPAAPSSGVPAEGAPAAGDAVSIISQAQEQLLRSEEQGASAQWDEAGFARLLGTLEGGAELPRHLAARVVTLGCRYGARFPPPTRERAAQAAVRVCLSPGADARLRQQALREAHGLCAHGPGYGERSQAAVSAVVLALLADRLRAAKAAAGAPAPDGGGASPSAAALQAPAAAAAAAALDRVMEADPAGTLVAMLDLLCLPEDQEQGEEAEELRESALSHLSSHLMVKHQGLVQSTPGLEDTLRHAAVGLLRRAAGRELPRLLGALSAPPSGGGAGLSPQGIADALEALIAEGDAAGVQRALDTAESAAPYLARGADAAGLFLRLVTRWGLPIERGELQAADATRTVLHRRTADLAAGCSPQRAGGCLSAFAPLAELALPAPPRADAAPESAAPDFNFTLAECALVTLLRLGRKAPAEFPKITGLEVHASEQAARTAAAQHVKSKELIDRERPWRERLRHAAESSESMLGELSRVRSVLLNGNQTGAGRCARLARLEGAAEGLRNIQALCAPLQESSPYWAAAAPVGSWERPARRQLVSALKRKAPAAAATTAGGTIAAAGAPAPAPAAPVATQAAVPPPPKRRAEPGWGAVPGPPQPFAVPEYKLSSA
eukprot:TRINITY_DN30743_c0_g1_i1.p1 TRINITY_DN30743_c0_g1~~TRINITY_DN30743_c0_g1_i1.p1  ORF type:complete len:639 (+),score=198.69 TRINITY_DN30743_c0_g1_i1:66-1919(+)